MNLLLLLRLRLQQEFERLASGSGLGLRLCPLYYAGILQCVKRSFSLYQLLCLTALGLGIVRPYTGARVCLGRYDRFCRIN